MKKLLNPVKLAGRLLFILAAFAVLYSYAMFQGGFVSWFLFYSFLPFLFYAIIVFFYPLKLFKVERIIDKKVYESGDSLTFEIKLTRRFLFPIYYLIIEDCLPESLKVNQCKVMVFPFFRKSLSRKFTIGQLPRGEHVFKEVKLTTSDFLGFIKKDYTIQVNNKIVVYPKVNQVNLSATKSQHEEGLVSLGFNKRESMIPSSVRDYQPGDRFSWINWKMTARKNAPMTKEFEKYEDQQVLVLMDRYYKLSEQGFEEIVEYTASLYNSLLLAGIPTGVISIGSDIVALPTTKAAEVKQQAFYHFATVKNDCSTRYSQLIEKEISRLPQRGTLLFITETMTKDLEHVLKKLALRPYNLIVILASPSFTTERLSDYQIGERIMVVSGLNHKGSTGVRTG